MPIQTSYPFNYSYPRLGKTESQIHFTTINTGLVVSTSPNIEFGHAIEGANLFINQAAVTAGESRYQRLSVQKAGAAIIASATFQGIAIHEDKQPEGGTQAFHTTLVDANIRSTYAPYDDVKILRKGTIWAEFDVAVSNINPQPLVINYLTAGINAGKLTTGAGTVATSVKLLTPTYTDANGKICGLVQINL
jgi:hypothetical protein